MSNARARGDERGRRREDEDDFEDDHSEDDREEADERVEDDREDDARDPREYVSPAVILRRVRERLAMADARVTTNESGEFEERDERADVGPSAIVRENMRVLDAELRRIVNSLKTSPQEDAKRQTLMNKFKSMIGSRFEGVRVAPFGSYVSAFHSAGSDIDISLQIDKDGPWYDEKEEAQARRSQRGGVRARRQQRQGRTKRAQLLRKVASELRYRNYRDVQLISKARVPLIKFKDPHTGVACDVCIENDGVYKSAVLGVIADIDQRYRDLVFLIKLWAKHYDVNNALEGSFNSYSLCLLVMHHLQRRRVPVLPPTMQLTLPRWELVQSEEKELDEHVACEDDQFDTWKVSKARVVSDASRDIAAVKYRADKLFVGFGKHNTETLAELFVSFFAQLCAVKGFFRNALNASTYHGRFIVGSSWNAFKYPLGVEDPFAAGDNVARAVQMRTRDYVLGAFPAACAELHRILHASDEMQFKQSLLKLLGNGIRPALGLPALSAQRVPPTPPGMPPAPGVDTRQQQQLLMQALNKGHAGAEELIAMLARQGIRPGPPLAAGEPQQFVSEQILNLKGRQEALLREAEERHAVRLPVASLFGQQPQSQPQLQQPQLQQPQSQQQQLRPGLNLPPGFGPKIATGTGVSMQMPSFGTPMSGAPPTSSGGLGGGLGGGVFSSIASGGGGLFFDGPTRSPVPTGVDEISQHFAAGMSMMGGLVHPPAQSQPPPQPSLAFPPPRTSVPPPDARAQNARPELLRTTSGAAIPKPRTSR